MLVKIVSQQVRTALVASRARLSIASGQACRTLLTLPALPSFQETRRGYRDSSSFGDRSLEDATPSKERSPSSTIWVGNLPYSVDESEVRDRFSIFGRLLDVRLAQTPEGRSRGFAHIDFSSREDARRAVEICEFEPVFMQDRDLRVDFAPERVNLPIPPHYKLYVQGFDGDEDTLRAAFQDHENYIVKINMLKDAEDGTPQQVGFIDFINVARAAEAKNALNGTKMASGTTLRVEFARKKPLQDKRGRFTRARPTSDADTGNQDGEAQATDSGSHYDAREQRDNIS